MSDESAAADAAVQQYLQEMQRVLTPDAGTFLCITLAQAHTLSTSQLAALAYSCTAVQRYSVSSVANAGHQYAVIQHALSPCLWMLRLLV